MKNLIITIIAMLAPLAAVAQDVFRNVLTEIGQNNYTLKRMEKELQGRVAAEKTAQWANGPEVEMGYATNGDKGEAHRKSLEVKQELPTMAILGMNRRYNRSMERSAAGEAAYVRMEIMRKAEKACIEWIYWSKMEVETENRQREAETIERGEKLKMEKGEGNRIDYNNAKLSRLRQTAELERIRAEKGSVARELQELNGGKMPAIEGMAYPQRELPENFDRWFAESVDSSAELLYTRRKTECEKEKVKWMKNRMIPDLVAGYSYEAMGKDKTNGVTLGIRIPLWREKKEVDAARWSYQAGRIEEAERLSSISCRAKESYERSLRLRQILEQLKQEVSENNNPQLIAKSMKLGNISMSDYLTQMSLYYETINRMFEVERDLETAKSLLFTF